MILSEHWKNRVMRRHLPNALILIGENRREMADYLAMASVCEGQNPPCGECIHCRKAKVGIHPDIIVLGADGESLKVDAVRALRTDAYIRPNEAERKVYVVENAHTMNQSGQNALLKLLEEGPDYATFFFLLQNPEQLLPTLRSRCEMIRGETDKIEAQINQEAEEFLNLICNEEKHLALLEFCVGLEKRKREELSLLLDQTIEQFITHLAENPAGLFPKLDALREIRAACDFTIGVGHITGWLMAALTKKVDE